jgi:protein-tyrosine phosphatase
MRTSTSDPIRIDFVESLAAGRIGLTIAPGKKDPRRSWDRDVEADLDRLIGDGAQVLASLMEEHEYDLLLIKDLRTRATAKGLDVRWFPIVDVSVPKRSQIDDFATFVRGLVEAVQTNKTVVIHCRGGIGRSGTVAACCLVQLGVSADEAIRMTRAARPGAIETPSQEEWVAHFATHLASSP